MDIHINDNIRRALGLAEQILQELPTRRRPDSNIQDMRGLLDGRSSGRDDYIICEAIATALAWRKQDVIANPPNFEAQVDQHRHPAFAQAEQAHSSVGTKVFSDRIDELRAVFDLVRQANAESFASFLWRYVTGSAPIHHSGHRRMLPVLDHGT
jgi:hypothetical protein